MTATQPTLAPPEPADETDGSVIRRSWREPAAFAAVFDRHWPAIHAYCRSRAGTAGEDIAAETFRIAFDQRQRFDGRSTDATPWLHGIATNLIRNHFRRADRGRRAAAREVTILAADEADETLGRVEAEQLGPELVHALQALSASDRDTLLLLAWTDLGYAQIAAALDVPVGTVRSRIHRARLQVRAHLIASEND
jgi:RNA polymerase sigma-70 factor (ECF subfamily)